MTDAVSSANPTMMDRQHLSLFEKTVTLASWSLVAALFLTIGWTLMRPDDPRGAVSLLSRTAGLLMFLQTLVLATGSAVIVTLMAGRYLVEVGTFAAAFGLMLVSLRGSSAAALLIAFADATHLYEQELALYMALECVVWFVVILLSMIASSMMIRFMVPGAKEIAGGDSKERAYAVFHPSAYDLPWLGQRFFDAQKKFQTPPSEGLRHTLAATIIGVLSMAVLSAGLSTRTITHGQACFVVAAGMAFATYTANRLIPVRSLLWSILAVPLVAILGLAWAALRPSESHLPAIMPSSHFLRILPIQYIAVGTASIVMVSWYLYHPGTDRQAESRTSRRPLSAATEHSV